VGLKALVGDELVGEVTRVDHLPSQDILAIETARGEVLVPFVKQIVPEVDIASGRITLTPPEGLFEVNLEAGDKDEN
jgi:16S rRNA processing protein RimM